MSGTQAPQLLGATIETAPRRCDGQVALITGAAQGLGLAMAERFAAEGADVALADLQAQGLADARRRLQDVSPAGRVTTTELDVADPVAVTRWVDGTLETFGRVDVLVNNAGILRDARVEQMTDADWQAVLDVSLHGTFNAIRAALGHMKARGYGRILSMSSMSWRGYHGQANYSAAKAGVVGLTRTVALEGARHGVTSNAIAPGPIDTPMLASLSPRAHERLCAAVPVGRVGQPHEIAEAAAFLCSPAAGFITGVVLDVDGGIALGRSLS